MHTTFSNSVISYRELKQLIRMQMPLICLNMFIRGSASTTGCMVVLMIWKLRDSTFCASEEKHMSMSLSLIAEVMINKLILT